jgi:asparagine synthase (glutamine-hydrolysing)
MSGLAGIANLDRAPLDQALLHRMASLLEYRGPDRTGVWAGDSVGLVHTLFATTDEARREQMPMSFDGQTWITADARIDGRGDLIAELRGRGRDVSPRCTEPELILHAYAIWGELCVERLLGDFAFAIWDGAARKLFCARDHFGVKPFFYMQVESSLIFGNSLDCVRSVPGASQELDEQFIADFLLFEMSPELGRTAFRAVRRLPPAHLLVAAGEQVSVRCYWRLPVEQQTVYKRSADYVERFQELFEQAVRDRLRADRVGVLMSGGLDSTSIAATAKKVSGQSPAPPELTAHANGYDRLFAYEEGRYARIAAKWMGIPIDYFAGDDYGLFDGWEDGLLHFPEPVNNPLALMGLHSLQRIARGSRVALTGFGGDPALGSFVLRHCRELLRQGRLVRLCLDLGQYLTAEGRLDRLHLRGRLARRIRRPRPEIYPEWLNPDMEKRLNLRARQREFDSRTAPQGAVRPEAYVGLGGPLWPYIFEGFDAGATTVLLEIRHPFFDLRLLRYLLSLSALPWCSDKEILRVAMKGQLPKQIRLRPKTLMLETPYSALRHEVARTIRERFSPVPELREFVVPEQLRAAVCEEETNWLALVTPLRPVSLNFWLKMQSAFA